MPGSARACAGKQTGNISGLIHTIYLSQFLLSGLIEKDSSIDGANKTKASKKTLVLALFGGLRYNYIYLDSGAQTKPPELDPAGEISAWWHVLTGPF